MHLICFHYLCKHPQIPKHQVCSDIKLASFHIVETEIHWLSQLSISFAFINSAERHQTAGLLLGLLWTRMCKLCPFATSDHPWNNVNNFLHRPRITLVIGENLLDNFLKPRTQHPELCCSLNHIVITTGRINNPHKHASYWQISANLHPNQWIELNLVHSLS